MISVEWKKPMNFWTGTRNVCRRPTSWNIFSASCTHKQRERCGSVHAFTTGKHLRRPAPAPSLHEALREAGGRDLLVISESREG